MPVLNLAAVGVGEEPVPLLVLFSVAAGPAVVVGPADAVSDTTGPAVVDPEQPANNGITTEIAPTDSVRSGQRDFFTRIPPVPCGTSRFHRRRRAVMRNWYSTFAMEGPRGRE